MNINETKKYTIHTETFEFNPTKHRNAKEAHDAYDDHNDKIVGAYDTIDAAREAIAEIRVDTHRFSYRCAQATVAWIAETVYNVGDDGELEIDCSYDEWDFKFEETPEC